MTMRLVDLVQRLASDGARQVIVVLPDNATQDIAIALLEAIPGSFIVMRTPPANLPEYTTRLFSHTAPLSLPGACPTLLFFVRPEEISTLEVLRLMAACQFPRVASMAFLHCREESSLIFLVRRVWLTLIFLLSVPFRRIFLAIKNWRAARLFARVSSDVLGSHRNMYDPAKIQASIMHVASGVGRGGAERQLVTVATSQRESGDPVELLCDQLAMPGNRFYLEMLHDNGIAISEPRVGMAFLTECEYLYWDRSVVTDELLEACKQFAPVVAQDVLGQFIEFLHFRPALVHIWQDRPLSALAAVMAGVPRILVSWRSLSPKHYPQYLPGMLLAAYKALADDGRVTFCANSRAGRDDYAAWIGMDPERIAVVHNGLDPDFWQRCPQAEADAERDRLGLPRGAVVVGGLFRLVREKNPRLWVEVAARVLAARPEVWFVLYGDGPFEEECRALAAERGLYRLVFAGGTSHAQLAYSIMDLFLLTSILEGCPNVLIEAQFLGVPVVTTDVGGCAETIDEGITGWMAPGGDVEGLAAHLIRLAGDGEARAHASAACRPFAVEQFSVERMYRDTMALYASMGFELDGVE